ncbi:MAG TPA: thioredoxin domain-containing protein [Thermoanaerobaculia bacterium]|nr:thioredoxin domain-containing protein [Thermoanaerobaculia bacterium]
MTNRLIHETSPYLLQHAHNPVDWYAWGEEAFARARNENKPVFLSIGYSACHWCHVMERESFENEAIAALLNRDFVSIKVDREERPDIDSIYMQAVQMMTGHGGWPMSMFLTPEGAPFYGGTYFPPSDQRGMPGFSRILEHVRHAFEHRQDELTSAISEIMKAIGPVTLSRSSADIDPALLDGAAAKIAANYDPLHGGFGSAPKFPPSMTLEFLMEASNRTGDTELREIIVNTLTKMARGGIYDQVGGGFHRYSVDARWLVPHFEKMLYDNALLTRLYVHAWQWTKDPLFADVVRETLGFVEREMTSPEGGFYSTLDADSEGEEGKFYVWSRSGIMDVLGSEEGTIFCALYDVTERGNFEGQNILNIPREPEIVAADQGISLEKLQDIAARGRCKLFGRRAERIRPGRDEKILAGWNGWMLAAVSEAALAFDSEKLRQEAAKNARFLLGMMMVDGRLLRSFKDGRARIPALLEDYSGVAWGLIAAFEATQEFSFLEAARSLVRDILERFSDPGDGTFFDTPEDHEKLITRPKDLFDNATPSGVSMTILCLQKLSTYFDDQEFRERAGKALLAIAPLAFRYASGFGYLLCAAEASVTKPKEVALTGDTESVGFRELLKVLSQTYLPQRTIVWKPAPLPLMEGRNPAKTIAYVCEGRVCREPTDDVQRLTELLKSST